MGFLSCNGKTYNMEYGPIFVFSLLFLYFLGYQMVKFFSLLHGFGSDLLSQLFACPHNCIWLNWVMVCVMCFGLEYGTLLGIMFYDDEFVVGFWIDIGLVGYSFINTRWWGEVCLLKLVSIQRFTGWNFGLQMRSVPSWSSSE